MEYGKDRLVSLLQAIDEEAFLLFGATDPHLSMVIVGGSAFLLQDLTSRSVTHDIDVLSCHEALKEVIVNYHAVNNAAAAYIDSIPYGFEDRLLKIEMETKAVDFFTPSLEDLAVMKLYGWRPNDQEDLDSSEFLSRLDWDVLEKLVLDSDEAKASALSEKSYSEMVSVYEDYARKHGHEPNI